jgi:hypothetical protein
MTQIDKSEWIETVTDSPILAKLVLRTYMKSQSARKYTQILDEFFILKADDYAEMPEIKVVLEDWLDHVCRLPAETEAYIEELFKYVNEADQQSIMSRFIDSLHDNQHTLSKFTHHFSAADFLDALNYASLKVKLFSDFLEPIDEFKLLKFELKEATGKSNLYLVGITVENHYTITKEHINALMVNLEEDDVIDGTWSVGDGK